MSSRPDTPTPGLHDFWPLFCSVQLRCVDLPSPFRDSFLYLGPRLPSPQNAPLSRWVVAGCPQNGCHRPGICLTADGPLSWGQQRRAGSDRNDITRGESLQLLPAGLPPESPGVHLRPDPRRRRWRRGASHASSAASRSEAHAPHRAPAALSVPSPIHLSLETWPRSAGKDALPGIGPLPQNRSPSATRIRAAGRGGAVPLSTLPVSS